MTHVVLLGDSVFDNGRYVAPGPDVAEQMSEWFPTTLLARDGAVTRDVRKQLRHLPADATHIVVSVGGNDALHNIRVLNERVDAVRCALELLGGIRDEFARDYGKMLDRVAGRLSVMVTTIYGANFASDKFNFVADTAVSMFNDVIFSAAAYHCVPVIDTRRVFTSPDDYANEIEPSVTGGEKLVHEIGSRLTMTRLQDIALHLRAAAVRVEVGDEDGALARIQRAKRMIKRKARRRDLMNETSVVEQIKNSLKESS